MKSALAAAATFAAIAFASAGTASATPTGVLAKLDARGALAQVQKADYEGRGYRHYHEHRRGYRHCWWHHHHRHCRWWR